MTVRTPGAPDERALVRRYVVWCDRPGDQRYLRLLHANLLRRDEPDQGTFTAALAEDARQIDDGDLGRLLGFGWRPRLTAAWLIGLDQRTQFRRVLGDLLLASEMVYSGQGYCFALARFGQPDDSGILASYLDRYLPRTDCHYDQDWAIGALLYLDHKHGTDHAQRFLGTEGAWHRSAFAEQDPFACQVRTERLCLFAERLMATGTCHDPPSGSAADLGP